MAVRSRRYPRPNLLVLLTLFVGLGVLLTSLSEAAEPAPGTTPANAHNGHPTEQWLRSLWSLDLAARLQNWKPKVQVQSHGEGLSLTRPLGNHGPALRLSASVPEAAEKSLRAGGDNRVGAFGGDRPDAFLFLHKRW